MRFRTAYQTRAAVDNNEDGVGDAEEDEESDGRMMIASYVSTGVVVLVVVLTLGVFAATKYRRLTDKCMGCIQGLPHCSLCSSTVMSISRGAHRCATALRMPGAQFDRLVEELEGEGDLGSGDGGGTGESSLQDSEEEGGGGDEQPGGSGLEPLDGNPDPAGAKGGLVNSGLEDGDEEDFVNGTDR